MPMFSHVPVLAGEILEGLQVQPGGVYLDCTLGGGGHSGRILEELAGSGRVIGLDRDPAAIGATEDRLGHHPHFRAVRADFRNLDVVLSGLSVEAVDGILFDLGVSSPQLDREDRGFSYRRDDLLDMRMDPDAPLTARTIVNEWSQEELERVIGGWGEERWARRIARFLVTERREKPVETAQDLVRIVRMAVPREVRKGGRHPARRTFQGLRIAVNDELGALEEALEKSLQVLSPGGRICVISFHSLEDRIVKEFFRREEKGCVCPPEFPACACGRRPRLRIVTRRPVVPGEGEMAANRRARSARLRVAERVGR